MSKAEKFIQGCTRNCSNELIAIESRAGKEVVSYYEWLTPDQARKAVEIAREEMIEKFEDWLFDSTHNYYDGEDEFAIFSVTKKQENIINDFKQAMKDE